MKIKRIISIVLIGLFASLFQGLPLANADSLSTSTSCTSTNNVVTGVRYSISASYSDGWTASKWYYSFDGSTDSYVELDVPSGNTMNFTLTSWFSSSFGPFVKGVSSSNVSKVFNNSSTSCNGIPIRSYKPTVSGSNAPTGSAGSGATLTSAVTFASQGVAVAKTYKWQRCTDSGATSCSDIAGATSATYVAGASDAGNYLRTVVTGTSTVNGVAQSTVGTSAATAQISESAPGTPGTPTVVAGDSQVTVTVVAPGSGGTPSSYTVTALDNNGTALNPAQTCTVSGGSGSCVISGLTNNTAYKFSSTATNGAGTSSASTASTSATPTRTVTGVTSSTANGSYKAGSTISIQITFSGPATVTGTPQITLETGSTDQIVNYASGTGTNTLTFTYTVQAGDTSADLDYVATTSLALNSGTIKDAAGNNIVLTLPSPAAANSLGANKAIAIDTTAPTQTISSIDISADTGSSATDFLTATASQTITGTLSANLGASESLWGSVDAGVTYTNISTFVTGTAISWTGATLSGTSSIKIEVRDAAGNVGTVATQNYELDTTAPTQTVGAIDISADTGSSATDFLTATASQTITGTLSANLGTGESLWGSVDGGANYVDVSSSVTGTAISWASATLSGSSSIKFQVRDSAGASGTVSTQSYVLDTTAPTPTVVTSSVTTASGVTVRSNEIGTAYLVKSTVTVNNLASITGAANDNYNEVTISAANSDSAMSTAGLVTGDYKLYVIDAAGNLSIASANTVTVAVATAPSVTSTAAPTGTASIGSTLTSALTFSGVPTPTLTYQWKSCSSATDTATACSDISGATSSSFIASAVELVGKFIRVLVSAINGIAPDASALSSPTAALAPVAPGVPTLGTPTLGDLQINVPFTAPASNGGSTIIMYQFSTDGGANWLDRTDSATVTSPIVIKFLSTNGTTPIVAGNAYPIQIRAVNSASSPTGQGTASVSVTAGTAPGAPTAVSATATGTTTATVSFTVPTNTGGIAITRYTVTSSPGGVTASGSSSPITVSGLNASTPYTFTVTATNDAATSLPSAASNSITTSAPPAAPSAPEPAPEPVCNAACVAAQNAAAAKVVADRIAAEAKVVSDAAAKVVADKVVVDKTAAEAAAKTAVEKATAAVLAKAAADAAAVQAATIAKAAADAQAAAVDAANKAAAALKSATTSAATKAAATATAAKAATTAANAVKAAATAAKVAAAAKTSATNASKQVDIAIGVLGSKTASASNAAQANVIAAAAKAAANAAAKAATDQAAAAKVASNNANKEAATTAASIVTEQKQAADAAAEAKVASDVALKATEEKIAAANEAQKAAEAVVKALEEKIALAEASVKAKDVTERAAIDKKIEEVTAKVAEAQKVADAANAKAATTAAAQETAQAAATTAAQNAATQAAEAIAVRAESIAKNAVAIKAAADASLAAKIATAAVAAAAKVPSKVVISAKPSTSTNKNSAKATVTGLKPGQKVKVTVNVKGN
jgi:hypothetical protein